MYFTITFCFDTPNIGLNLLLVQSKWLGWNHNDADCKQLTRDEKMAPNLDKVEVSRCRRLTQVGSAQNLFRAVLKCSGYYFV